MSEEKFSELEDKDRPIWVKLDNLYLDPLNPRLPTNIKRNQHDMLDYLAKYTSIEDLMNAIAENNYFSGEPLIAFEEDGKYFVVEGNRRLTALKLINNPNEVSSPSSRSIEISENARYQPQNIPVVVVESREAAIPYLGYRHITGVKQWEPLAKARYIKSVFDKLTNPEDDIIERLKEVANIIGSRRDHIRRNLEALSVYEVIEKNEFFGIQNLNESSIKFSVLSTALADERFSDFIGLDEEPDSTNLNTEHIKELTEWIYKKDNDGKTRLGESRNLRSLAAVISSPKAIEAFRRGATLQSSYRLTNFIGEDFITYLYESENTIMEAASLVANVEYSEDAYEIIKRISQNVKLIGKTLKSKQMDDEDDF